MSGEGIQMRVAPDGLRTSARVVTSKVRHWPSVGSCVASLVASSVVSRAKICPGFANARPAEKIPAERRKSRHFITHPLHREFCSYWPAEG